MTTEEKYMKQAIHQAKKAYALDEVPIGCVIVYEGKEMCIRDRYKTEGRESFPRCRRAPFLSALRLPV